MNTIKKHHVASSVKSYKVNLNGINMDRESFRIAISYDGLAFEDQALAWWLVL